LPDINEAAVKLFIFGIGYTGKFIAEHFSTRGDRVSGTVRSRDRAAILSKAGIQAWTFGPDHCDAGIASELAASSAILVSVPPGADGDPVFATFAREIAAALHLRWIGYLSTIGVYGDHNGAWVDEETPTNPVNERSRQRVLAEQAWLSFGEQHDIPVQIFRLAGIYGPGRNQLVQLAEGTARRVIKPGQVFNRIHVEDIVTVIAAAMDRPQGGAIYNVTDDAPAPPQDVVRFAASLCGREPPPTINFADAELTPMSRTFFSENKRVRNYRLRDRLGVRLRYPSYHEGLTALMASGDGPFGGEPMRK
jgi:nucleoside-diphosphate-sugar epimerase